MISVAEGLPGSGKNLWLIKTCLDFLLPRNQKIRDKTGAIRKVICNFPFGKHIREAYPDLIGYWKDAEELVRLRNCDIIIDEIANYFDSRDWQNLSLEVKMFMRQHRKRGINIYAATQDFATIDLNIRRITTRCFRLYKIFGSRDISATRPIVRHPWGQIVGFDYDPGSFRKEQMEFISNIPSEYFWITKRLCMGYDTQFEIEPGSYPPLKHIERSCANQNCEFHKISHV